MTKWIDMPPVWLAAFVAIAWSAARIGLTFPAAIWLHYVGIASVAAGVLLLTATVIRFYRARTTIIPKETPQSLVTTGPMRISRNPIYLGDALILFGLSAIWQSWVGIVLVPVFAAVITRRFILGEEARLSDSFGAEFDAYRARVRRWL